MNLGLRGKVAIVTGASRGLGKACASILSEEGCTVVLCARTKGPLKEAADELIAKGGEALGIVADVSSAGDAKRLVEESVKSFGQINILVNSVGGRVYGDDDEAWQQAFEMTFLTAARCTRLVVPHMHRQGGGAIVHIGSIWGRESGGVYRLIMR